MFTMKDIESVVTKSCENCAHFLTCWLDDKFMDKAYMDCENWYPDYTTIQKKLYPEYRKRGELL